MRSLVGLAHQAELGRALEELYQDFKRWKSRAIDSFELSERIHTFHHGPNREIYLRYTSRLDLRFLIEYALQQGLIQKSDIPDEIAPYVDEYSSRRRKSFEA